MLDKVILVRDAFYKIFIVSFIYYLLITALYLIKMDFFIGIMETFYKVNPQDTQQLIAYYLSIVEIITFNLLLIPAIGLHWLTNSLKKRK